MKPSSSNSLDSGAMMTADDAITSAVVGRYLPPDELGAFSDAQIDKMLSEASAVPVDVAGLMAGIDQGGGSGLPSGRDLDPGTPVWQALAKWATVAALLIALGVVIVKLPSVPSSPSKTSKDVPHTEWQMDFPPPVFVGTPPVSVPGLTDPLGNPIAEQPPRMTLRLPADARSNVALGKRVSASDALPMEGELGDITDGVRSSEAIVTLDSGMQWVQLDLDARHEIYGIALWHDYSTPTVYFDVVVEISDDPDFEEGVLTVFNNSRDGVPSENIGKGSDLPYLETNYGCVLETSGVKGRYVRLYSNGCSQDIVNRYTEVEIYRRLAQ
ncbi:MAG: hypothetical protein KDN22_04370 [Verrucomicrobiae bacterium]|nr:hypothetical protein [Verrucomicrobiae bacterium]